LSTTVKLGVEEKMMGCDPAAALEMLWQFVSRCNKYVDETAPWKLAKDPAQADRLNTVLYTFIECIRILGILCAPFMPGVPKKIEPLLSSGDLFKDWDMADCWNIIKPGTVIQKGEPLFPRIDVSELLKEKADKANNCSGDESEELVEKIQVQMPIEPLKEEIGIDDFAKLDLRIVKVLKAEKVEKTDKLLKLEIEMGDEIRTVVSGIAQHYSPEELVGKKVVLVANLKPAKLRGIVSQGMILAVSNAGELEVLSIEKDFPTGAQVK